MVEQVRIRQRMFGSRSYSALYLAHITYIIYWWWWWQLIWWPLPKAQTGRENEKPENAGFSFWDKRGAGGMNKVDYEEKQKNTATSVIHTGESHAYQARIETEKRTKINWIG